MTTSGRTLDPLGRVDMLCHRWRVVARRISHKLMHFGAYLALSLLPVIGFRDRRSGIVAGLSTFVLGVLLEAAQHFSPGRSVEFGDVLANGAGVSCGALLGLPFRTLIGPLSRAQFPPARSILIPVL